MKKTILLAILVVATTLKAQEKANTYDLDLYQKRLTITPKLEFGIFSFNLPYYVNAVDASFVIQKNLIAQASLGISKICSKSDLGIMFAFQNRIVTRKGKVFDKLTGGNTYQVLITNINIHKLKGLRGGFFRKGFGVVTSSDMKDLGYGNTTIKTSYNGTTSTDSISKNVGNYTGGGYIFKYSTLGAYGGIFIYSSKNHTNTNHETGMSAKGYKNQFMSVGFDVLVGSSTLGLSNKYKPFGGATAEIDKMVGRSLPIGGRFTFEAGIYFGQKQNVGLLFNAEFGKYPGADGISAIAGIGLKINLLDKIVSN
jgi:hypothetical protein